MVSDAYRYRHRPVGKTSVVPFRSTVAALAGRPLSALATLAGERDGAVVRLDLGLFRPYLVTRPEHVQHVLVGNAGNYLRGEMLWRPVRRLIGWGLGNEGEVHTASRRRIQPLFSSRHVGELVDLMAAT